MDKTRLIAELKKQYGMSDDLAGRVAENILKSGYTRPYQKAVDGARAPQKPGVLASGAKHIVSTANQVAHMGARGQAYIDNYRVDPRLANIVAQGGAPVPIGAGELPLSEPIPPEGIPSEGIGPAPAVNKLHAAHQLTQTLVTQHGLDPQSAMILAAKLYPVMPHDVAPVGRKGGESSGPDRH